VEAPFKGYLQGSEVDGVVMKTIARRARELEADRNKVLAERLAELLNLFEQSDPSEKEVFKLILVSAVNDVHIKPAEIAQRFKLNQSTVGRWVLGETAPIAAARTAIADWLIERMKEERARLRKLAR